MIYSTSKSYFNVSLNQNGHIKKREIQQLYCDGSECQRFLADRYVIGTCYYCKDPGARGDQCDACGKLINQLELIDPYCKVIFG
jgi:methionyl-tRNA synthetase